MRKIVVLLTGMVFILGVALPVSHAQYKKEKKDRHWRQSPSRIPSTWKKRMIRPQKKCRRISKALKGEQKAPAAPEQKAVTANPPAPAETKAQATTADQERQEG